MIAAVEKVLPPGMEEPNPAPMLRGALINDVSGHSDDEHCDPSDSPPQRRAGGVVIPNPMEIERFAAGPTRSAAWSSSAFGNAKRSIPLS
jgi:hypothetical protein